MAQSSEKDHKHRFTLGYWSIRGLAQPARMMLVYGAPNDHEFQDYKFGPAPEYSRDSWFSVKPKMGLDFPNLPYLFDHKHNLGITESHAIYRYLARELKIGGSSSQEKAYEEMIGDSLKDLGGQWTKLCYSRDFESLKGGFVKQWTDSIQPLEKWLKGKTAQRKWLGGQDLCYGDFILFEFMDQTSRLYPNLYEELPELKRFYKAFKELKPLQDFFKSERCTKYILNGPGASFK